MTYTPANVNMTGSVSVLNARIDHERLGLLLPAALLDAPTSGKEITSVLS